MNFESLPLRDIHLPAAISWWPPAPGWWLLALLTVLLSWFVRHFLVRWRARRTARQARVAGYQEARQLLAELRRGLTAQPEKDRARYLVRTWSTWLRRVAMSHYGREKIARLTGSAWLAQLDQPLAPEQPFSRGPGCLPIKERYRPAPPPVDAEVLWTLSERWLQALRAEALREERKNAAL